jgi:hypothetical protein
VHRQQLLLCQTADRNVYRKKPEPKEIPRKSPGICSFPDILKQQSEGKNNISLKRIAAFVYACTYMTRDVYIHNIGWGKKMPLHFCVCVSVVPGDMKRESKASEREGFRIGSG